MDDFGITLGDAGKLDLMRSFLNPVLGGSEGRIETVGDEDRFRLEMEDGRIYFFFPDTVGSIDDGLFFSPDPLPDPELRLFDAGGTEVDLGALSILPAFTEDGERFFRAPASGTFLLSVQSASGTGTGDYRLVAGVLPDLPLPLVTSLTFDLPPGTPPRLGQPVTATLDFFNMSGRTLSGLEVELRATTSGSGEAPVVIFSAVFEETAPLQQGRATGTLLVPVELTQALDVTIVVDPRGEAGIPVEFEDFRISDVPFFSIDPPRRGTEGDDEYVGNTPDSVLVLDARGGDDRIFASFLDDNVQGGAGDDEIVVYDGDDRVSGGSGSDSINAGPGADRVDGGAGNDSILGGEGNDRLFGRGEDDMISGDDGSDMIRGGDGSDAAYGGSGRDNLTGDRGNDSLFGGDDRDRVFGGDGNDDADGGGGDDQVRGGNGRDTLFGGDGNDKLQGDAGDDDLYGGAGRDLLRGGIDSDILDGGTGRDVLLGEGGPDRFLFEAGDGYDKIFGFDETDRIELAVATVDEIMQVPRGHWFVRYGDGDLIRVDTEDGVELVLGVNVLLEG